MGGGDVTVADGFRGFRQFDGVGRTVLGSLANMDISSARTGVGSVSGRGGGASFTCARAMAI